MSLVPGPGWRGFPPTRSSQREGVLWVQEFILKHRFRSVVFIIIYLMTEAVLAPFVARLVEIFESDKYSEFVEWNDNEIYIKNPREFTENVIPYYFKLQKIESFMRQLNLYGFSKVPNSKRLSFKNQNFFRGDMSKLKLIQLREKARETKEQPSDPRICERAQKMLMDKVLQKNKDSFQKCLASLLSKVSEFVKSNPDAQSDFKGSLSLLQLSMNDAYSSGPKSPISDYSNKTACDQ